MQHKFWILNEWTFFSNIISNLKIAKYANCDPMSDNINDPVIKSAHTSWGLRRSTLKMAFQALVRSKLDYTAPAWQPWLSETNLTKLDRLQNRSLWLITDQLVSTPLEALRLEVDVQSYSTCSKRLILKADEKARRRTDDHPKRIALDVAIPQRLQSRSSFHRKAEELSTLLPPDLQHRQNIIHFLLHHGSKAPLIPDESPPLSQVLPVELTTTT